MKRIVFTLLMSIGVGVGLQSVLAQTQNSLIIQPDAEMGKDAYIRSLSKAKNQGNHPDFDALRLTFGKRAVLVRSLMQFDLSGIPENAEIVEAQLTLFKNKQSVNLKGRDLGNNTVVLRRVTKDWNEQSVNWKNQPTTTKENQIIVPSKEVRGKNEVSIDITNWIADMHVNPSNNFGWMMKLNGEKGRSKALVFASSDHADASLHPMLTINYKLGTATHAVSLIQKNIKTYPNPFVEEVKMEFDLTQAANVSIAVRDMSGQIVKSETYGVLDAGRQIISFVPTSEYYRQGMYVVELQVNEEVFTKKLVSFK